MENNKLDKRTKWSYCIGATGRDMAYALISMFLLTYIQYTMKLTVAQYAVISAIMVVCLLWDAINDPMMGIIIENSHLKAGKFKPWIFIGVILNSLIIICLFTVRPEGWGFVAFFGVGYLLWGMTYTMNDIAYWGMLPSLTSDTLKFIPVKELQDLRKNKQEEADILIKEDEKKELRSGCVYETEMRINLKKSTADKIRLNLRMSQGKKTEILFDLKRAEAYFDRNNSDGWSKGVARCPLNLMGKEHLDIHIYSDKISLEIFSNDYQNNFSCNIYNVDDDQKNEVKAIGGDLVIESIRSWELEKTMK